MEKEINEVKITYLAETGTGLVHLLMNNYDDNGRVLETKHSNNCYIANALLVIVHDIYDSIDSEAERLVELTEEINNSVFDIELSASNDLSDRYCSAYLKIQGENINEKNCSRIYGSGTRNNSIFKWL